MTFCQLCPTKVGFRRDRFRIVTECYYVNCPTLYVPVRGVRFRRWLNLRKLGGVGFAPYHECGLD